MRRIFFLVTLIIISCQSTRQRGNDAFYSEKHLDFQKWGRTNECCTAKGKKVAIASGGTYSSRAGLEVIDQGGNAVDAAVAVAFTLAVERPHSCGLGGGGFMTLHLTGKNGGDYFVDFRETAPAKATRDMYLGKDGNVVKDMSVVGSMSFATPGFVVGMYDLHKKWGKLAWAKVLAPAARLAREGFVVYPSLAEHIVEEKGELEKEPYIQKILFKNGVPLKAGEKIVQEDLGKTIDLIAKQGKTAFTEGEIAKKISQFSKERKGILTASDLKNYKTSFKAPIQGNFSGYTFLSAPPPSAGGVLMAQMFNVLSGYDLTEVGKTPEQYYHLLAEVMKRAYADRSQYIGDPDFFKSPFLELTKMEYANKVRERINLAKATPSQEIGSGEFLPKEKKHTTHLSIIDGEGNALASTLTINDTFGSRLAVPGTGIFMNDEMDDFSAKPGEKNIYGLQSGESNSIAPGKRPVSSMSPTVFLKDGKPVLAVGGAGGSRIISSVAQVSLNYLFLTPKDAKKALFAPRMHHQWIPDKLSLEKGLLEELEAPLKSKGHTVEAPPWSAIVHVVGESNNGELVSVFDPRDEGGAEAK